MKNDIPESPYYAAIFTSLRTEIDEGYEQMAQRMLELATTMEGFLHADSVRQDGLGITVSYWRDQVAIQQWKQQAEHLEAQRLGREKWYASYRLCICKVEREYGFEALVAQ